jgi:diaminopimelate decarboxylase
MGAKEFGLHTMYASNSLELDVHVGNVKMQLELAADLEEKIGINVKFINIGGGVGDKYRPSETEVSFEQLAGLINQEMLAFKLKHSYAPLLYTEYGRIIAAPHGVLVGRIQHVLRKHKLFFGVNFCDGADLHRANIYESAYHSIYILNPDGTPKVGNEVVADVVGPLCENVRLARDRVLPMADIGDIIVVGDASGHGWPMGFQYNDFGASPRLWFHPDDSVSLIARGETNRDLRRTAMDFAPRHVSYGR